MNMKEGLDVRVEEFLFGHDLMVDNYFIEITPVSEMVGYTNEIGRASCRERVF